MLRIGKLSDYATGLMAQMALAPERRVSAQQLALELGLPPPTVASLLKKLARAGLVRSVRGPGGGYGLAQPARDISVGDVVSAIEGPVALTDCALADGNCSLEAGCITRANWRLINRAVRVALDSVSLADMAGAPRAARIQTLRRHE